MKNDPPPHNIWINVKADSGVYLLTSWGWWPLCAAWCPEAGCSAWCRLQRSRWNEIGGVNVRYLAEGRVRSRTNQAKPWVFHVFIALSTSFLLKGLTNANSHVRPYILNPLDHLYRRTAMQRCFGVFVCPPLHFKQISSNTVTLVVLLHR